MTRSYLDGFWARWRWRRLRMYADMGMAPQFVIWMPVTKKRDRRR